MKPINNFNINDDNYEMDGFETIDGALESLDYMLEYWGVSIKAVKTLKHIIREHGEVPLMVGLIGISGVYADYPYGTINVDKNGSVNCIEIYRVTSEKTLNFLKAAKAVHDAYKEEG